VLTRVHLASPWTDTAKAAAKEAKAKEAAATEATNAAEKAKAAEKEATRPITITPRP
jgi:hypothetical protein